MTKARVIIILSFVFMLAYPGISGSTVAAGTGPSVNISNDAQSSSNPQVVASGNHVYAVWVTTLANGTSQVMFSRSGDFGVTWSSPLNLSSDSGPASYARISASGSNVYVLWDDKSAANGNAAVYFRVSQNNGSTWASVVNLSAPAPQPSRHFRFITQGNSIYVAWVERVTGNNEIQFTSSDDAGLHWTTPQDLSNDVNDSINIGLSIVGANLFMVWMAQPPHFQILERSSPDRGATWGSTVSVSNDAGMAEAPDIYAHGTGTTANVFVVWQDNTTGNFQTMMSESQDGADWSIPINLSHDTSKSVNPAIGGQTAGSNSYVYVAWTDNTPGSNSAYLSVSKDGGKTFSAPIDLSSASYYSTNVKLQVMPHAVLVLWEQQSSQGTSTVEVRASYDFGAAFGPAQNMGPGTGTSMSAFFNVPCGSAGSSYVIWVNPNSGSGDIYVQGMPAQADTLRLTQLPLGVRR